MADVRLTATNPENSEAVPVACNAKGELLLEAPQGGDGDAVQLDDQGTKQVIKSAGLGISDGADEKITLGADGNIAAAGNVDCEGAVRAGSNTATGINAGDFRVNSPPESGLGCLYTRNLSAGGALWIGASASDITTSVIFENGSAQYLGDVTLGNWPQDNSLNLCSGCINARRDGSQEVLAIYNGPVDVSTKQVSIASSGAAVFSSDVIIGSRGQKWMIVESNGLAHLVQQAAFSTDIEGRASVEDQDAKYPPLRNLPGELTMVEEQLQKVMEKLRMTPEAGWEVWDGSSDS